MTRSIIQNVSDIRKLEKIDPYKSKSAPTRDTRERVPEVGRSSINPSFTQGGQVTTQYSPTTWWPMQKRKSGDVGTSSRNKLPPLKVGSLAMRGIG